MARTFKLGLLWACKAFGVFCLFRALNRRKIRIICYHGFALAPDQAKFRPKLFMVPETFRARMAWLKRSGYRVISLREALAALRSGEMPENAVVVTMDDGLVGVARHGAPIMQEMGCPFTVYVTTWYVEHQLPMYNLVVPYLFWKSESRAIAVGGRSFTEADAMAVCREKGPDLCRPFLAELARAAGIDFAEIECSRMFGLMNTEEIASLAREGVDIQLHTHRHRWPKGQDELRDELAENIRVLRPLTTGPLDHFCYPSGVFSEEHWPILREMGIRSATTLERGMADPDDDPLRLPRLLDGSNLSHIEFEARMCGFLGALQKVYQGAARRRRTVGHATVVPAAP